MRAVVLIALLCATTAEAGPGLNFEQELPDGQSFTAYLVSYVSAGLKVHAMVAVPNTEAPAQGFPVVIANHGYVPDPRLYGIGADGVNSRPGDYYRSVPELYASRGFLVILPDFRGHNNSEGYEQIRVQDRENMAAIVAAYAADVVALISHLDEIELLDLDRVFMWSHSMGGGVSMRALLETDVVRASSFWATMAVTEASERFASLEGPVMIHHSIDDASTTSQNSRDLADELRAIEHPITLNLYKGADHLFEGDTRERAADLDAEFFRAMTRD
jgi:dienelactone hydrolase